ncbi:MAG TPA: Gfo/Idh/MocA family oxidoreductase [bacterium]|nr:Gfo/Idh/MocA family oxidoreductase [bacterium]
MRVGVVGAGFIGRLHALNLKADPRVDLVGVADTVPAAAQRLAGEVGTKALPDLAALLDAGAVYVTTPNSITSSRFWPPSRTAPRVLRETHGHVARRRPAHPPGGGRRAAPIGSASTGGSPTSTSSRGGSSTPGGCARSRRS